MNINRTASTRRETPASKSGAAGSRRKHRAAVAAGLATATTHRIRTRSIALAGVAGALLIGLPTVLVGAGTPAVAATTVPAAVPTFPDNLNVFPNRDFVSVDGYLDHAGEDGTVTVTRPGVGVVGAAVGRVSGGDVAFEVNHPGGICWGNAPGTPNITPDIQPGDVVSISFGGVPVGATTVQDVWADDAVLSGTTMTVTGHIGPNVDTGKFEQRIIEPALVDTVVAKRDVRAIFGPPTAANKGGYVSSVAMGSQPNTFVATYVFDDVESATLAANAGLGERAMAWEVTDPAANRQGMTIAENGEPGGPGMGGCPNGPLQSGPPGPTDVVAARVANGTGVQVSWKPAVSIPGTPAIEGYRVIAVAQTVKNGEQVEIGKKIANPNASGTTIDGLTAGENYDIEVMSYSSTGYTYPAIPGGAAVDSTPPVIKASPAGGSYAAAQQVALTSNEMATDIYYTLDGTDPIVNGDSTSATAVHYTGPITIGQNTVLKFGGFDGTGNASPSATESYTITNAPVAGQPTAGPTSTAGIESVTLNWGAAAAGAGATITGYQVDVFSAADTTTPLPGKTVTTAATATTATISGLTGGTAYMFTVRAHNNVNPALGQALVIGPLTPQSALRADAGADKTDVARGTVVTLSGAASKGSVKMYSWSQLSGPTVPLTKVVNVPGDVTFTLPLFTTGLTNDKLTFRLTVSDSSGATAIDDVVITPHIDPVVVTKAIFKPGDFRVVGAGAVSAVGGTVNLRSATGALITSGTVAADGSFDLRLRSNVPNPGSVYIDSAKGGVAGPFKVTT